MSVTRTLGAAVVAAAAMLALGACGGGAESGPSATPSMSAPNTQSTGAVPSHTGTAGPSATGTAKPSATDVVGRKRAGTIVTDKYGGRVIDVESDTHGGEPVWEVEVADSRKGRIEVDVTKHGGDIVDFERD